MLNILGSLMKCFFIYVKEYIKFFTLMVNLLTTIIFFTNSHYKF